MTDSAERMDENLDVSCGVLLSLIKSESDPARRDLMIADLLFKAAKAGPRTRSVIGEELLVTLAPKKFRSTLERFVTHGSSSALTSGKKQVDIIVVSIIPEERMALKIAFDVDLRIQADAKRAGMQYWETNVESESARRNLSVVITMAEARNTKCAVACGRIFDEYSPRCVMLVGIAAGLEDKVKLGCVVAAEAIVDYGHVRVEPGAQRRRPDPQSTRTDIVRALKGFEPELLNWHAALKRRLAILRKVAAVPPIKPSQPFTYDTGIVISGDLLFADGITLEELRDEIGDNVRAGEQDGSGFSKFWDDRHLGWIVFRGISDYGDPRKRKKSVWKRTAALSAATVARLFLEHVYTDELLNG